MTRSLPSVPRALVVLAALSAMLIAACSGTGATPAPTARASVAASRVPSSAPSAAASGSAGGSAAASGGSSASCPTKQPAPLGATDTRTVTINTSKGPIAIKVEGKLGPIATGNFVALAQCGYYDNVVFHRLVPGFVIQGGDGQFGKSPNVSANVGSGGPGYTIKDEPVVGDYTRGTVAMARTPAPNSQGSQFFIVLDDLTQRLDKAGGYVILGHVVSGMDAVDAIAADPNSGPPNNEALQPVPMTSVTVVTP